MGIRRLIQDYTLIFLFFSGCLAFFFSQGWGGDASRIFDSLHNYMTVGQFYYQEAALPGQKLIPHDLLVTIGYVAPFYALGQWLESQLSLSGITAVLIGLVKIIPISLIGVFFFALLRHYMSSVKQRFLATCLLMFTSILPAYSTSYFSEPLTTLSLIVSWDFLLCYKENPLRRWLWGAGLLIALSAHIKLGNYLLVSAPLLAYMFYLVFRLKTGHWKTILGVILLFGISMLGLLQYAHFIFGTYRLTHPQAYLSPDLFIDGFWGLTLGLNKGLFIYNLPLVFIFSAVRKLQFRLKEDLLFIGALSAFWLLLFSCMRFWHGGVCWGPRYLIPLIPFLYLPVVLYLFEHSFAACKKLAYAICFIAFCIQLLGLTFRPSNWARTIIVYDHTSSLMGTYRPSYADVVGSVVLSIAFVREKITHTPTHYLKRERGPLIHNVVPDLWIYKAFQSSSIPLPPLYTRLIASLLFLILLSSSILIARYLWFNRFSI